MSHISTDKLVWKYEPPPDRQAKVLLLTKGKVAIIGRWGSGLGVIAWQGLPSRDKELERKMGL